MKTLVYNGPKDVSVIEVPDAKIERPTDVMIKVTAINICGSDLHIYEGRNPLDPGMTVGHETPATDGYKLFDDRDEGWTKVILHP